MLVLVVDTATPAVTAALVTVTPADVQMVGSRVTVAGTAHGELLAPAITALLAEQGAAPGDLAAVVAGTGPGPFTGLRVGLVTAVALGQALARPGYGVCSLDGLGAGTTGRVLAATDARRREVYWAVYEDGRRVRGPEVNRPAEVPALAGPVDVAVGDGALRYPDELGIPVLGRPRYPDPLALARLAADRIRAAAPGEPLTPRYLRRPDAQPAAARKPVLPARG